VGRALVGAIENIAAARFATGNEATVRVENPSVSQVVIDGSALGQAVKEGIIEGLQRHVQSTSTPPPEPVLQTTTPPPLQPESSFRIDGGFLRTSRIQPRVDANVAELQRDVDTNKRNFQVEEEEKEELTLQSVASLERFEPTIASEESTDNTETMTVAFNAASVTTDEELVPFRDTRFLSSNQDQESKARSSLSLFQGARVGTRAMTSRALHAQDGRFTPIVSAHVEHAATLQVMGMSCHSLYGSPVTSYSGLPLIPSPAGPERDSMLSSSSLAFDEQPIEEGSTLDLLPDSHSEEQQQTTHLLHPDSSSLPVLLTHSPSASDSAVVLGSRLEDDRINVATEEEIRSPVPSSANASSRPHRYSPDSQIEEEPGSVSVSDAEEADYSIVTEEA